MKKKNIVLDDMVDADLVDLKKLSVFKVVHGIVWEHPSRNKYGLLLYIPLLDKESTETILKLVNLEEER